jgi:hypothetical protein
MGKRLTEEEYDNRIAVHGKVVRIGKFVDTKTKILHLCLKHNQEHLSCPEYILSGRGLRCCRAGGLVSEKEYDERISVYGRVARVEPFKGTKVKIIHRCLEHNKEYLGLPVDLLQGKGLLCCKGVISQEEYDEIVAVHGKVIRLEPYVDLNTKILHKCLIHNFEDSVRPITIKRGCGLICCGSKGENLRSREAYKDRVKKIGKVEPLENYIDNNTPIKHRCLIHGYECYAKPRSVLSGEGLACCGSVGRKWSCKENYVERVNKIGKVEVLGEYINNSTPILHRCKIHNHVALANPSSILAGKSLLCCKHKTQSLLSVIKKEDNRETIVYLHRMANYPEYIKLGMSCQIDYRSRDPEYGDMISYWYTFSRLEAYCIEQASLRDILICKGHPEELESPYWPGLSEIITNEENLAIDIVQYYVDKLEELGPYQFILDFLSPNKKERGVCLEKLKGGT